MCIAQAIFFKSIIQLLPWKKLAQKFVFFIKLSNEINRPNGENLPNLVTLLLVAFFRLTRLAWLLIFISKRSTSVTPGIQKPPTEVANR
jgi:hypothetical protein